MKYLISYLTGILLVSVLSLAAHASNSNDSLVLLTKTLDAIEFALNYFHQEHPNLNLDAVIGTRMVEGQFKVLLKKLNSRPENDANKIWNPTIARIERLQKVAGLVSEEALPYIAAFTPQYYNEIGPVIQGGFWEMDYPSRDFDPDVKVWQYREGESLREQKSDDCLAEFFGTGKKSKEHCRISDECWDFMTSPGYNSYSLSHQVLYLEIGRQFGCYAQMLLKNLLKHQKPINELQEEFCKNMLNEAVIIAKNGFPQRKQDLFMEQAALCGILGYREFFTSDWLTPILSWQDELYGCYKGELVFESEVKLRPGVNNRRKREERPLDHGCLCHRTTVALAALGQYVRYISEYIQLLETMPQ
ncbi:UPF0764 protein C16orf89 homolog [Saccostrea echinata]|uniref:UPF0764 protein C16orf89 homolog n=1 Tax=Saccostrea echinata TaxID=191078 RepID=UPI002A82759C|nr:UPF0764 protein C16orf89 homolog [Saccostrea echinata]